VVKWLSRKTSIISVKRSKRLRLVKVNEKRATLNPVFSPAFSGKPVNAYRYDYYNNHLTTQLINHLTEFVTKENTMFDSKAIIDALVGCDEPKVLDLVQNGLDEGVAAKEILNQGLIAGMDVVGEKMENEDMFIPEVLMAAKVMSAAVGILKPLLAEEDMSAMGRVIIGTVKGDLHDIGKNLVAMMLESAGFEVYNLGVDISPDKFVSEVNEKNANMVCLSALLTTTMPMMKQTIDAVVESGLRDRVKIMVGGAPVTKNYANEIGADGYAPDAGSATKLAKALLQ